MFRVLNLAMKSRRRGSRCTTAENSARGIRFETGRMPRTSILETDGPTTNLTNGCPQQPFSKRMPPTVKTDAPSAYNPQRQRSARSKMVEGGDGLLERKAKPAEPVDESRRSSRNSWRITGHMLDRRAMREQAKHPTVDADLNFRSDLPCRIKKNQSPCR